MKRVLATAVVFALSAGLAGQSKNVAPTAPAPAQTISRPPDVNAILTDLKQAAEDTQNDVGKLRTNKWGKNSYSKEADQTVLSVKRNLAGALPELIGQVRSSHGSVVASFKLYDDLSVLCETLVPLVTAAETYGKQDEYGPLVDDFSRLTTIRRRLSSYIEARAGYIETKVAALESKGNSASAALKPLRPSEGAAQPANKSRTIANAAGQTTNTSTVSGSTPAMNKPRVITDNGQPRGITENGPTLPSGTTSGNSQGTKKIIIDDNVPDEKPARKKKSLE